MINKLTYSGSWLRPVLGFYATAYFEKYNPQKQNRKPNYVRINFNLGYSWSQRGFSYVCRAVVLQVIQKIQRTTSYFSGNNKQWESEERTLLSANF